MSVIIKYIKSWKIYYIHLKADYVCGIVIYNKSNNKECMKISVQNEISDTEFTVRKLNVMGDIDIQDTMTIISHAFIDQYVKFTYKSNHQIRYIEYGDDYKFRYIIITILRKTIRPLLAYIKKTIMFSGCLTTFFYYKMQDKSFENKGENIEKSLRTISLQLSKKRKETLIQLAAHLPIIIPGILNSIRDYVVCPAEWLKLQLHDMEILNATKYKLAMFDIRSSS